MKKRGENTCFQLIRSQSVKFSTTHELDVKCSQASRLGVKYSIFFIRGAEAKKKLSCKLGLKLVQLHKYVYFW